MQRLQFIANNVTHLSSLENLCKELGGIIGYFLTRTDEVVKNNRRNSWDPVKCFNDNWRWNSCNIYS